MKELSGLAVRLSLLVLASVAGASSLRILALLPHPGGSHFAVVSPLLQHLARRNHQVTVVSYFPLDQPPDNYRDVSLLEEGDVIEKSILNVTDFYQTRRDFFNDFFALADYAQVACEKLSLPRVRALKGELFDVVLAEMFNTDCFLGLVGEAVPVVGISTCTIMPYLNQRFANPDNPSYIPNNFLDMSERMTFFERLENTVWTLMHYHFFTSHMEAPSEAIARRHLGQELPPLHQIVMSRSQMLLVNTHFTVTGARPQVPAVVDVGGMHLGSIQPLPKDLEDFVNGAEHGVIFLSFGSMLKTSSMPVEKKTAFLNAFAKLPQRIVWKWEEENDMPNRAKNVMLRKWVPQRDLICHPKVRAFITHGGLLSTLEGVHCGVPMVIMPMYGDQFVNAHGVEVGGGAVRLPFAQVTESSLLTALRRATHPNFLPGVKALSAQFNDRPLPPLETATYWLEYVARHQGANRMRTAAVGMPIYQYLLLDVVGALLLAAAAFIWLLRVLCKAALGRKEAGSRKHVAKKKDQ